MHSSAPARVSVLGAGSYGTALAVLCHANAPTMLWARDPASVAEINQQHSLERYLPDVQLPEGLSATASLQTAMQHALGQDESPAFIILGVPVAGLAQLCTQLSAFLPSTRQHPVHLVHICKGFDAQSGDLPHVIAELHTPHHNWLHHGVLSGPSFAIEVAKGLPVGLTIASDNADLMHCAVSLLHGTQARIYSSHDVIGVEVGGALKNIIAIACGIGDGLGQGANARAALITRGLAEIQRLGVGLGGLPETFQGLTGLGDLVLSSTSDLSRNRRVGLAIGQGEDLQKILSSGMTAEGVRCAEAARTIALRLNVHAPITEAVYQVLQQGLSPRQAVHTLLARDPRKESA